MRALISLTLSLLLLVASKYYVSILLTQGGEYRASLYIINNDTTRIDIISSVKESNFVSHSYISSPGLSGTAVFVSNGRFIDDDELGNYIINYRMRQTDTPKILDSDKANFYINMVGRLNNSIEEKIKLLYQEKGLTVFDMNRNNNIIMYSKLK